MPPEAAPFGWREKGDSAEGVPALPVARGTVSSPERIEASEGEMARYDRHDHVE